jgi:hypothetical protein
LSVNHDICNFFGIESFIVGEDEMGVNSKAWEKLRGEIQGADVIENDLWQKLGVFTK